LAIPSQEAITHLHSSANSELMYKFACLCSAAATCAGLLQWKLQDHVDDDAALVVIGADDPIGHFEQSPDLSDRRITTNFA
jgi:hypothetical protein